MADKWLVDGNIDVDIHQLQDFAKHIKDELEQNFRPSFEHGIKPMLTVRAPFGGGGLREAGFFRDRHDESRMAAAKLMGDVMKGLTALSTAAMSISAEYLTGDALAQATNDEVLRAFSGVEGQKTLDEYWASDEGKDANPDKSLPEAAEDPGKHNNLDSGPNLDLYRDQVIAPDQSGEYLIAGDDEDLHNPNLAMPKHQQ